VEWDGSGVVVEEASCSGSMKLRSPFMLAASVLPVISAEESISRVHVFQEKQMLVLHDKWQLKVTFTLNSINHSWEYLCFASSRQKLPLKSLVDT